MMDLDELRTVQRTERQKDSLQHLRDSFYQDVADYVAGLKQRRDAAADASDDPFGDPEVRRLSDEIETAEEVVESLYERRVGKVVKSATFAAADMGGDQDGLTEEERELYDDLVARIRENRGTVLDTLSDARAGDDAGAATDADAEAVSETPEAAPDATADADGSPESPESSASTDGTAGDRTVPPDASAPTDDLLAEAMGEGSDGSTADGGGGRTSTSDDPDVSQPATDGQQPATDGQQPATDGQQPATDGQQPATDDPDAPEAPAATPGTTGGAGSSDADHRGANDDTDGVAGRAGGDSSADADRTTVRITRDVGEILGVDERAYSLEREDVVTLPADNAEPLLRKDAAERLD